MKTVKPIAFFDLETTGVDKSKDRIVEIAIVRFDGGNRYELTTLINPEIPIPKEASEVHGITDQTVMGAPTLAQKAKLIHNVLSGCVLAGFNSNSFDIPLLVNELHRVGYELDLEGIEFLDVCNIFKRKEERTLTAAVKFYCGKEHEDAHGALADVNATIEVFEAMKGKYKDLPASLEELNLYCNYDNVRCDISGCFAIDKEGDYILNFGKHKGSKAKDCRSYLSWMQGQDFMPDTKKIISKILAK